MDTGVSCCPFICAGVLFKNQVNRTIEIIQFGKIVVVCIGPHLFFKEGALIKVCWLTIFNRVSCNIGT